MKRPHYKQRVAVLGFGSQGRAQSNRLRSAGADLVIGLPSRSRSRRLAKAQHFTVTTPARAVRGAEAVAFLVPDQLGGHMLSELGSKIERGALVIFAAGYPLAFPYSKHPTHCDLVMVAPHGPGNALAAGLPMSGFVGVQHDDSGRAKSRARTYARAIGLAPLMETTPRLEALGDLFGEQALLCGGLVGLVSAVATVMVKNGLPPTNAYYETVAQLEELAGLLARQGVRGFWQTISDCAAYGASSAAPQLFDRRFAEALSAIWTDVESGRFAKRFQARGRPASMPAEWKILERLEKSATKPKKRGG